MSEVASIARQDWGSVGGAAVELFTLRNGAAEVKVSSFGAMLTAVRTADRDGVLGDILLGSDVLEPYLAVPRPYLGAVIGRFANRIADGRFSLDGIAYTVPVNNSGNALHGGPEGFDGKVWAAEEVPDGVAFRYSSPDGEMGFPGRLDVLVNYTLMDNTLRLDYEATCDKPTVVNLTNHAFWNLDGFGSDVGEHLVQVNADHYTPVNERLIPTGEIAPVEGTPMDLRVARAIGVDWDSGFEQIARTGGYDHNWCLQKEGTQLNGAAFVRSAKSGRTLAVHTNEPGVQFYSGNFLKGDFLGREGAAYGYRTGFCLETQHYPDSPNQPGFPTTVLRPGEVFRSTTVFTFGVDAA